MAANDEMRVKLSHGGKEASLWTLVVDYIIFYDADTTGSCINIAIIIIITHQRSTISMQGRIYQSYLSHGYTVLFRGRI
jgi:hypothetical protein